jgi:hypothetical protein
MPSLAEISQAIASYRAKSISLDAFEDWFRDNSRGMFGEGEDILAVCVAIEQAFSRIRFDDATEQEFREELVNAILPFEKSAILRNVYGAVNASEIHPMPPQRETRNSNGWTPYSSGSPSYPTYGNSSTPLVDWAVLDQEPVAV